MSFIRRFLISVIFLLAVYSGSNTYSENYQGFEGKKLSSTHFIIYYREGVRKEYIYNLKEDAEYFYRKITQELGLVRDKLWMWDNRAKIFVASDRDDYLNTFKCQSWSGACVSYWDKTIYTYPYQQGFRHIIAHELTHIIFREFVGSGRLPLWLDEGMAMYIEYKYTNVAEQTNVFKQVRSYIREGSYIPFVEMNRVYGLSSSDKNVYKFYQQAFSMVYYLLNKFGSFKFKQFLIELREGSDVNTALSKVYSFIKNVNRFEELWKKYYLQ